jgi:alpha-beta hydrolase superfamily lysophospholipase
MTDVTALYYPEARHELLNETNRDAVQADVVGWLDRVTAPH